MEISSFELIFKPQSPVGAADTVLQGYFLNVTNLEDVSLTFRLNFVTSSITDPDRSLFANTVAIIDTPNVNNSPATLIGGLASPSFRLSPDIVIAPNATAKVALLPSDPFPDPTVAADFECRGFADLTLPAVFTFIPPASISFGPQLDRPARVLVTPQNRATYLNGGVINDQTQAGLPTGPGGAVVEIEPEQGFLLPFSGGMSELLSDMSPTPMPDIAEADMALMFAALADADLKSLNAKLKDAGIGLSLEKRKA
ncbi:MAG: hypothetical protein AAF646_18130 [Pseudomonadota bacterium]